MTTSLKMLVGQLLAAGPVDEAGITALVETALAAQAEDLAAESTTERAKIVADANAALLGLLATCYRFSLESGNHNGPLTAWLNEHLPNTTYPCIHTDM